MRAVRMTAARRPVVLGAAAAAVFVVLALVAFCTNRGSDPTSGGGIGTAAPTPTGGQGAFQVALANDRLYLLDGTMSVTALRRVRVSDPFPVRLEVCGPAASCAASPEPAPSAVGTPGDTQQGRVKVGSHIGAELTSNAPDAVGIDPVGVRTQPVIDPADRASWEWHVTPTATGEFSLTLGVTTLRPDAATALLPTTYLRIPLVVEQTIGNRIRSVGRTAKDTVDWVLQVLAAMAGLGATTWLVTAWRRRRGTVPAHSADRRTETASTDPEVRRAAVTALAAELPDDATVGELLADRAHHDPAPAVREAAVRSLADRRPVGERTVTVLKRCAVEDPDPDVRRAAIRAVVAVDPSVDAWLASRAADDPDEDVRVAAGRELRQRATP
ncbi:HEAT repeat domain-containing protein [Virgisporangium ochraceum]|uniref:HEAT repeat domain-containing protein n=1 Tax=Virgisporangium ochraceum TaxID=65505 RepID=A0A8J4A1U4_9ACTN|nr:HEAT repeat domain-containing protein [Virgisporangium ochraceum]GIJ74252.1 hypothetical protein Voc01_091690 [Virgisporangium ochraceum]